MIEKMEKLHIYCLRNQTSDIMEELLKAGVVQTERTQSMLPEDTARVLQPGEGLDLSREETLLADLTSSIETLKVYGSKKGLFAKRPEVSYSSLMDDGMLMDTMKICERVSSIVSEREELNKELKEVEREREVQRKKRLSSRLPLVALVGYTNAGKSTIMNGLVERYVGEETKKVLEKDMLFATLDTTVRRIDTGNNHDFLLSDTVGFIHKLPHGLVKAFRSTLEEVKNADLLLQVVDRSDPYYREQMETTQKTLQELGAEKIPMLVVYNKVDRLAGELSYPKRMEDKLYLSAKEETSLTLLVQTVLQKVYADLLEKTFLIPYDQGNLVSYLRENAQVLCQEYEEEGTLLRVRCHLADAEKYRQYLDTRALDHMALEGEENGKTE